MVVCGAELYELRADAGVIKKRLAFFVAKAALHAKAIVFDRQDAFTGSFNRDLRSGDINTEAGLYVESPELAEQVIAWMDEGVLPENSYRVLLDDGEEPHYDRDHMSTFGQRSTAGFIRTLPVENHF